MAALSTKHVRIWEKQKQISLKIKIYLFVLRSLGSVISVIEHSYKDNCDLLNCAETIAMKTKVGHFK